MLDVLRNRVYRKLLLAQIIALLGTGLATVALALLAYELAGDKASAVLGTALFIKMIAYVGISPFASAIASVVPRKQLLIAMDLARVVIVLLLPFVDQIWQIYVLIFILQSCSALFTPTFQAVIPDVLPDEAEYTRALSLSRLAYDLENLLSPALAAMLLFVMGFHWLFIGTAIGFLISAYLVFSTSFSSSVVLDGERRFFEQTSSGIKIFLYTPRLRGLLALNLAVAAGGAMVIVNSVIIVRSLLDRSESELGIAMAAFGAGSMIAALLLPRLLERISDRSVMLMGGALLALLLALFAGMINGFDNPSLWVALLIVWFFLGLAYSCVLTPTGRLLKRSAHASDRPAIFATQFAFSHACWLFTYPLAGWLGTYVGLSATLIVLSALALISVIVAFLVWPSHDPIAISHSHPELPSDHPHLLEGEVQKERHSHPFIIDDLHARWPGKGH